MWTLFLSSRCFNPRAPCGARQHGFCITTASKMFQSTRPMRGATSQRSAARREDRSFNPRAPCGARPQRYNTFIPFQGFNPRAPCGARRSYSFSPERQKMFQSTRPVWGATYILRSLGYQGNVSIHAPRVGRDHKACTRVNPYFVSIHAPRVGRDDSGSRSPRIFTSFNPRAPCGARPRP